MTLVAACLLAFFAVGPESWAWTTSNRLTRPTRASVFRLQASQQTNPSDDKRDLPGCPQSSTSRRQWLAGVVASATGVATTLGIHNRPALAAVTLPASTALCDPTVSVWERNGRVIYLLGTAHISELSAELAGQLVRDTHPNAVFVELDLKRIGGTSTMAQQMRANGQQLSISASDDDDSTKATRVLLSPVGRDSQSSTSTIATATSESPVAPATTPSKGGGGGGGGLLNNLGAAAVGKGIKGMYSKLGSEGFNPGEEFIVAIKEGQKQGAAVVLGDQDVDVTLRRMAQAIQKTDLNRLLNPDSELEQSMREMLPSSSAGSSSSSMSEKEAFKTEMSAFVETMKTKENVKRIMALMKQEAPALYQVMVSERDAYMAAGLDTLNEFAIITAVMGLAHLDGVETNLQSQGWKPVPVRCPQA